MQYIVPVLICGILIFALFRKKPTYELFIEGVGDGLHMMKNILPPMLAIMSAVYMMRASGAFDLLITFLSKFTSLVGIPSEVLPLILIRPLSGSGALGIFTDILNQYGADSEIGKLASVINGSTETTFYCLCVYFSTTKVKHTLKVIPFAIFGDLMCILFAVITVKLF